MSKSEYLVNAWFRGLDRPRQLRLLAWIDAAQDVGSGMGTKSAAMAYELTRLLFGWNVLTGSCVEGRYVLSPCAEDTLRYYSPYVTLDKLALDLKEAIEQHTNEVRVNCYLPKSDDSMLLVFTRFNYELAIIVLGEFPAIEEVLLLGTRWVTPVTLTEKEIDEQYERIVALGEPLAYNFDSRRDTKPDLGLPKMAYTPLNKRHLN